MKTRRLLLQGCFGPGQCQARPCTVILRHIVLGMAALAICAVTAAMLRDRTDTQAQSRWFHKRARLECDYALVS